MSRVSGTFTAVVLAGDRGPDDPVARSAGVPCKALVPVAGRPMVLRVLDALAESRLVGERILCGNSSRLRGACAEIDALLTGKGVGWVENEASPSLSARAALALVPAGQPALVTTADHALLTPAMVDHFCSRAAESGCDVVAGLARADRVMAAFPEGRRTVTRLAGGGFCGCNLFAFLTPRAGNAARFWRRVEEQRKHPLKIVRTLGVPSVLRYLCGRLTLEQGLDRLSALMDARAGVVWMPDAETAVDVDKVDDLLLAESILARRARS